MKVDIKEIKDEVERLASRLGKEEVLAVGLFGSMARGDFDERSDIDIFVITEREMPLKEQDELYYAFSELIPRFGRDITVLVYDINGLKKIPTWQTLQMVKDACFLYDKVGIEGTFRRILQKAEEQGIIYDDQEKVFRLKRAGRVVFSLEE